MPMTAKEMIKLLKANGFVEVRQNGSHKIFENPETERTTTVPYHCKDLPKGTEQAILKQAGLK
ncbi:type II toxin-antitoxin system HicA family toxin [Acetobacterium wieringae]|uniref:type II toxin-antitoxin system HicA family toxin n=1 Tax=Acetobacterium wieringae TaxID=52694 RepID=UPI002B20D025|nr:type II toxin-antitoxin system HicA family toxin [Acetobacterium wieringae]MEA4805520.1 type II toxin-antitoxin system HicA family toxin [Acetobacterium wieringae]